MEKVKVKPYKAPNPVFSIILVFVVLLGFFLLFSSFVVIDGGYQGVIFSKVSGVQENTFDEGFHMKVPFIDSVIQMEIRNRKIEKVTSSTSKDQQVVKTTVALNYKVRKEQVNKVYQELGLDYEGRVISPALEGAVKSVMAQYEAEELIQKRDEVALKIRENLQLKLNDKYLDVLNFEVTEIDFSDTYDAAIEAKVEAQQQALKAENELAKIKIEAEQKVVRAEASKKERILTAEGEAEAIEVKANAEAKAIKVIQEQLKNSPDYVEYFRVSVWDGKLPNVVAGESDVLLSVSGDAAKSD